MILILVQLWILACGCVLAPSGQLFLSQEASHAASIRKDSGGWACAISPSKHEQSACIATVLVAVSELAILALGSVAQQNRAVIVFGRWQVRIRRGVNVLLTTYIVVTLLESKQWAN